MTQEDKKLLLNDLCARLPHGVKFQSENIETVLFVDTSDNEVWINGTCIDDFKPYLRPMSNMTEEEKKEYRKVCELDTEILSKHPMDGTPFPALYNSQDWLDAHHFDYRGLIPLGLAIDATNLNIY